MRETIVARGACCTKQINFRANYVATKLRDKKFHEKFSLVFSLKYPFEDPLHNFGLGNSVQNALRGNTYLSSLISVLRVG